ncbi:unnamed protein product, partial [Heterosigma akashiwo]
MMFALRSLTLLAGSLGFLAALGFKTLLFFTCLFYFLTSLDVLDK